MLCRCFPDCYSWNLPDKVSWELPSSVTTDPSCPRDMPTSGKCASALNSHPDIMSSSHLHSNPTRKQSSFSGSTPKDRMRQRKLCTCHPVKWKKKRHGFSSPRKLDSLFSKMFGPTAKKIKTVDPLTKISNAESVPMSLRRYIATGLALASSCLIQFIIIKLVTINVTQYHHVTGKISKRISYTTHVTYGTIMLSPTLLNCFRLWSHPDFIIPIRCAHLNKWHERRGIQIIHSKAGGQLTIRTKTRGLGYKLLEQLYSIGFVYREMDEDMEDETNEEAVNGEVCRSFVLYGIECWWWWKFG